MLLHIFLILIVFAIVLMLLGFAWESFPLFILSAFLFFSIAGLSVMIQIPYTCGTIEVFNDDASRVFFLLMGILSVILAILYKLGALPGEAERE